VGDYERGRKSGNAGRRRLGTDSGFEEEQPEVKIVAMSAAFVTDVLRAARALGAHISLVKPISKETILQSIGQVSKA
jgi:DNA-binding NarL/FixJ family response regulator